MSPLLVHKLWRIVKYALVTLIIAGVFITFSDQDYLYLHLFYLLLGAWAGVLQEFIIGDRFRKLPWVVQIVLQTVLVTLFTMVVVAIIIHFKLGDRVVEDDGLPDQPLSVALFQPEIWKVYLNVFIVTGLSIAYFQLETLVGRYTFPKYLLGSYDKPVREELVVMFMDVRDSTTIAEKLGDERYFDFLNDTLYLMTDPALRYKAEILKYIGDEVVFTWSMKRGIRDANCLRIYFDILDEVERNKEMFLKEYGIVPGFRAGVHCGHVITAMIGHLKKGIDHSGDVMNTTARIAGVCSPMNAELITSKVLLEKLDEMPVDLKAVHLGAVSLKGKEIQMELEKIEKITS